MVKRLACALTLALAGCPRPNLQPPASVPPPPSPTASRSSLASSSSFSPPAAPAAVPLQVSGILTKAADGKPLAFVIISVDDLGLVTNADAYGAFRLDGVPAGTHPITLSGGSLEAPVKQAWTLEPGQASFRASLTNAELGIAASGGGGGGGGGGGAPPGSGPPPGPKPTSTAKPPPTSGSYKWSSHLGSEASVPQSGTYQSAFHTTPIGQEPSEFIDVIHDLNGKPSWLYPGAWTVQAVTSGSMQGYVYNQSQTASQPYFSMRRYQGQAFSTNDGAVPNHYQVNVTLQPLSSPYFKTPVGETALLAYYHDPGNYVKLVVQEASIDVWAANNAIPGDGGGWKHYFSYPFTSEPGTVQTIGAIIDANAGTLTPQINGQSFVPIQVGKITPQRHYVGLCSAGNSFNAKDLVIQSL